MSVKTLSVCLHLLALAAYLLCFVHLRADFPNHSPWNDWAKMTDEGWYGGGAVHRFLLGRWLLPGSFNPVVALPVWPAMLAAWFAVTGPGMVAARVLTLLLFGVSLVLLCDLVRQAANSLAAAAAVALVAASPFAYAFGRLAVLEPVMVLWLMTGLWLAGRTRRETVMRQAVLGIVLVLLVLTKTTGLFLSPAVFYMLYAANGWPRHGWLRPLGVIFAAAVLAGGLYIVLVVRPHLADYRLLFSINRDRVHLSIVPQMAWKTLRDGLWIGRVVYGVALAGLALSILWLRRLWHIPIFGAAVLGVLGYLAFIGYHSNLQPRYYLVVVMPATIVAVLTVQALMSVHRPSGLLAAVVLGLSMLAGLARIAHWAIHPEYSLSAAAEDIARRMRSETAPGTMLLSNSGDDVTLLTGIPALPSEYSTIGLEAVLARYRPGWYAAWQGREDPWTARVSQRYRLEERARYKVFDDPARDTLVLYRLTPRSPVAQVVTR